MSENQEFRWTPAALRALLEGDLENAVRAATPGGIEAQEAQGQQDFVASETLPFKGPGFGASEYETRGQLEALGVVFVEQVDDLFWAVRLPPGWKKVATEHSMWSKLLDEKGRERASIFYKAAFYDRSAHISLTRRFSYQRVPEGGLEDRSYGPGTRYMAVATDCGKVIWASRLSEPEPEKPGREWWDAKDALAKEARAWLDDQYPDWEDPLAYWD